MFTRIAVCMHAQMQMQNVLAHIQAAAAALITAIEDSRNATLNTRLPLTPLTT